MSEYWSVSVSVLASVITAALSYGAHQAKIENQQKEIDRLSVAYDGLSALYVAQKHFDFVVQSLQRSQDDMKRDLKEILVILSHRDDRNA